MRLRVLALLGLGLASAWATAHDLDVTTIRLTQASTTTHLTLQTPLSRLVARSHLGSQPTPADLDLAIRTHLSLTNDGKPVPLPTTANLEVDSGSDVVRWEAEMSADAPRIDIANPFDTSTEAARTLVLRDGSTQVVGGAEEARTSSTNLASAGFLHVVSGLDHVLFVVGMALLVGTLGGVLRVLTAFTIAHSLSMAAAALGWANVNSRLVEPAIALSIVALAVEGLFFGRKRPDRERWQWVMAFGFGLVHGLGFAGGLTELGLSRSELPQQLLGFSVGIELAQVAVASLTLVLALLLVRATTASVAKLNYAACVALGMIGSFWFMERLL